MFIPLQLLIHPHPKRTMDVSHTFRPMFEGLGRTKPCMFGLMFCHLVIWWEAPGPVLTGGLLAHSVGWRSTFHGKVLLPRVHKHSHGEMLRLTVPNDHVAYLLAASCRNQQSLEFRWFFFRSRKPAPAGQDPKSTWVGLQFDCCSRWFISLGFYTPCTQLGTQNMVIIQ